MYHFLSSFNSPYFIPFSLQYLDIRKGVTMTCLCALWQTQQKQGRPEKGRERKSKEKRMEMVWENCKCFYSLDDCRVESSFHQLFPTRSATFHHCCLSTKSLYLKFQNQYCWKTSIIIIRFVNGPCHPFPSLFFFPSFPLILPFIPNSHSYSNPIVKGWIEKQA